MRRGIAATPMEVRHDVIVRAALSAVPAAKALRLGQPPVPGLPIWLAATGERTMRVAADRADAGCPLYLRRGYRLRRPDATRSAREPVQQQRQPLLMVLAGEPPAAGQRHEPVQPTPEHLGEYAFVVAGGHGPDHLAQFVEGGM